MHRAARQSLQETLHTTSLSVQHLFSAYCRTGEAEDAKGAIPKAPEAKGASGAISEAPETAEVSVAGPVQRAISAASEGAVAKAGAERAASISVQRVASEGTARVANFGVQRVASAGLGHASSALDPQPSVASAGRTVSVSFFCLCLIGSSSASNRSRP